MTIPIAITPFDVSCANRATWYITFHTAWATPGELSVVHLHTHIAQLIPDAVCLVKVSRPALLVTLFH